MADPGLTSPASRSLRWSGDREGDVLLVSLNGDIDENANLFELKALLSGDVRLDLGGVHHINSAGVRDWVNFIREAGELTSRITLVNCSPAIVMQMNMIANFRGGAAVESIFAPFACPSCDHEQDGLILITETLKAGLPEQVPHFTCDACGAELELDDIPERYFAFLRVSAA